MRWGRRLGLAGALLALTALVAQVVLAITWPRDDAGTPAPPAVFLGSGGQPTLVSTTDRLPVDAGAGTTSSTDPSGWGLTWSALLPANTGWYGFYRRNAAWWALTIDSFGNMIVYQSARGTLWLDSGRWVRAGANYTSEQFGPVVVGPKLIIWWQDPDRGTGTLHVKQSLDGRTWTRTLAVTIGDGVVYLPWWAERQGNTIAGTIWNTNDANPLTRVCRSADGGETWAGCSATIPERLWPASTRSADKTQSLASPASGVWLLLTHNSRIYRSTDDAASFTLVTQLATNTLATNDFALGCIATNVCLATAQTITGNKLWRTTDGGLTWTLVTDQLESGVRFIRGLGQGTAIMMGANLTVGGLFPIWRSLDSGQTWQRVTRIATANPGAWACVDDGAGTVPCMVGGFSTGFAVSRALSGQERLVRDDAGNTLSLTSAGEVRAAQGAAAGASGRWPVYWTDGTNERGTATLPLRVDPTGATVQPVRLADPGKTLQRAVVSLTTSGTIVAGVAGRRIKVYAFELQSASTGMTFQFLDGPGGSPLGLQWTLDAREGAIASGVTPPTYLFAGSQGTPLHGAVTGTGTVHVAVSYWSDDAN